MRFGLLQEGETPDGVTHHRRYKEMIEEVVLAEEMGFDFWGTSEQHFVSPTATVSAPEVLYGAVAARTNRIRIRHMITLLPFQFNHPIRVAERIACLDVVSDGRAELGTGRGNHVYQLEAFGAEAKTTRAEWEESLEVIVKALTQDPWEHQGRLLHDIPSRPAVAPRPVQQPHPPLFVIGTSVDANRIAGEKGIGTIACDSWFGWEYMQECIDAYRSNIAQAKTPLSSVVNNSLGVAAVVAHCAETMDQAMAEAGPMAINFLDLNLEIYPELAKASADYAYMDRLAGLADRLRDLEYQIESTPTVMIGDPDYWIRRVKKLEGMGVDEIIVRIDGVGHDKVVKALELIGKYVIPECKAPATVIHRDTPSGGPF